MRRKNIVSAFPPAPQPPQPGLSAQAKDKTRREKRKGRRALGRTALIFGLLSLLAIAFDKIYALFAHGIYSPYMTWMFLVPLAGGALAYGLLALAAPGITMRRGWRAGYNLYNAGLASLSAGCLLRGIFEIAGTASAYTAWFFVAGTALALAGIFCLSIPSKHQSDF